MRYIHLILFLLPSLSWAYDFDLSTPEKTYQTCVVETDKDNINEFAKEYLAFCLTKEGKINQIADTIFLSALLEAFGGENADPNQRKDNELERILNEYGGIEEIDREINNYSIARLDKLFLTLIKYSFDNFYTPDKPDEVSKLISITIEDQFAKGTLEKKLNDGEGDQIRVNFYMKNDDQIYFKLIDNNWLIHERPSIK